MAFPIGLCNGLRATEGLGFLQAENAESQSGIFGSFTLFHVFLSCSFESFL